MPYAPTEDVCLAARFCCALLCENDVTVIKAEAGFLRKRRFLQLTVLAMSFFWILKENIMHDKFRRYGWIVALGFLVSVVSAPVVADEMKQANPAGETSTLELSISPDGRSIVDQSGKEVARFREGMQVKPAKSGVAKMQGCMCCEKSCIIYDENGKCIKWVNSCTWDFDCSCKK